VLAGLPKPHSNHAFTFLKAALDRHVRSHRVVLAASPKDASNGLYQFSTKEALIRETGRWTIKKRRPHSNNRNTLKEAIAPSKIITLYVPSHDSQNLLDTFSLFSLCLPLGDEDPKKPRETKEQCAWRVDNNEIDRRINDSVDGLFQKERPRQEFGELNDVLWEELVQYARQTAVLLPPRNFMLDRENGIWTRFRSLGFEVAQWKSFISETRKSGKNSLISRKKVGRKLVYVDYRGRAFVPAKPTQLHGSVHPTKKEIESRVLVNILCGLYRLGMPIEIGFHFDVQKLNGKNFNGEKFYSCEIGDVRISGSHVNVSPNDFIRANRLEKQ